MGAPRPCIVSGCTLYAKVSRCPEHEAEFERTRQGTGRRGTSSTWAKARSRAISRDNYSCRQCGRHKVNLIEPDRLEVHHRDGDPSNDDLGNLVTLCSPCHRRATAAARPKVKNFREAMAQRNRPTTPSPGVRGRF